MISITRSEHGFNGGMRKRAIYSEEKMEETRQEVKGMYFEIFEFKGYF